MSPEEIREINVIEAADALADIRATHQPEILPNEQPCPTGCCCTCGTQPCHTGLMLKFYDDLHAQFVKHRTATHEIDAASCKTCLESDLVLGIGR